MEYKALTTPELKDIRKNTISFIELKEVEKELLLRKAIRKGSFAFLDDIKAKVVSHEEGMEP